MELRSPKAKKKSSVAIIKMWGRMLRTPLLILFLLGAINCDNDDFGEKINSTTSQNGVKLRHSHGYFINNSDSNKQLKDIKYLRRHLNKEIVNFVMLDYLIDGEKELRIHYNGITAKETSVGSDRSGLTLRQLTDGRHLIQVIYAEDGSIQDCEYITRGKTARSFLKTIRNELKQALDEENFRIFQIDNQNALMTGQEKFYRHFENVTFRILKNRDQLPSGVSSWFDYENLKSQCLRRHEEIKHMISKQESTGDSATRSRRSLREFVMVPETKWCGVGQLAQSYQELGPARREDRCCRSHDLCRFNIGAFRRKFGVFNVRPFTVSHCRCDRRFRACLKLADTSVSNMVGNLFFNVVQTKCFVLKPVKVCTQRSWWGKCLKRGYTKQAFLRNNLPY